MFAENQVEAFAHYLATEEGLSPGSVRAYTYDVRQLRAWLDHEDRPPHQRGRDWEQIGPADLRAYLAATKPAPRRSHRLLASWRKFWRFLAEVQKLPGVGNPAAEIKRPKLPGRLPKFLTTQEVGRLLDAAHRDKNPKRGLRNWALLAVLYGTGLRLSEALGLTFDRISYRDGLPHAVRVIGKGNKEREVILSPTAQRALVHWLKVRKLEGHPTAPHVFSPLTGKARGKPIPARTVQKMLGAVAVRAGLDPARCTPHKLRHSYATALAEHGRGIDEIRELLGHESIATTQIYAAVSRRRLEEAAAALPDVF